MLGHLGDLGRFFWKFVVAAGILWKVHRTLSCADFRRHSIERPVRGQDLGPDTRPDNDQIRPRYGPDRDEVGTKMGGTVGYGRLWGGAEEGDLRGGSERGTEGGIRVSDRLSGRYLG